MLRLNIQLVGVDIMDKQYLKKSPEELQQYLIFRRKGSKVKAKKGKGSYKRDKKVEEE